MRLCLVSSIIALLVSIQAESRSESILLVVVLSLIAGMALLRSHLCQGYLLPVGGVEKAKYISPLIVLVSVILTSLYCQFWLDSRLVSRLTANDSGLVISGIADAVVCDYSKVGVEKYVLDLVSVDQATPSVSGLRKISVLKYLPQNESINNGSMKKGGDNTHDNRGCGFRIKFSAKLRAPYSFINPVGFDYEAWLLSKGVDATGYFISHEIIAHKPSIQSTLINLRQKGIERASALPGLSGQVVPALLFGVSGYLSREYWADLQVTGAIHLLVVSGLHVGFLVLLVVLLWRKLIQLEVLLFAPSHSYLLRLTPIVLLVSCVLYAYMAGFGLAVQRSSLMLLFAILVSYYKSHWSMLDTWLWVIWLVLIINPLASLFIGFWFSFMAVGCLLLTHVGCVKTNSKQADKKNFFKQDWLLSLWRPQWIVFLALMPFLWMFQQSQSLLSLLVNTIAIPLLALCLLPLSLLALLFQEGIFTRLLNELLGIGFGSLNLLAGEASWLVFKPMGLWLFALLLIVITILTFKGFPFRRLSLLLVGIIYFLPLRAIEDRLIILDVGQGLSVVGVSQHKEGSNSWVYDTGARFRSGFSLGEAVVAKNLLSMATNNLDLLFISHSDNDHAGGEEGLKRKINVLSSLAGQPSSPEHRDCHGLELKWQDNGRFRWRAFNLPADIELVADNDQSCVVQLEINGKKILIPGDIGRHVEQNLVKHFGNTLKSDVLLVPHHGSKTSSSKEFIRQVSPMMAIVSSGFKNSYKHPHSDVVKRYQLMRIPLYITAISGAIEINFEGGLKAIEWRKLNPPIWRQM